MVHSKAQLGDIVGDWVGKIKYCNVWIGLKLDVCPPNAYNYIIPLTIIGAISNTGNGNKYKSGTSILSDVASMICTLFVTEQPSMTYLFKLLYSTDLVDDDGSVNDSEYIAMSQYE